MDKIFGFVVLALILWFAYYYGYLEMIWKEFNGCITFVIVALVVSAIISLFKGNSNPTTPRYPLDNAPAESAEYQADMMENDNSRNNDPCAQDIMNGVPDEFSRCNNSASPTYDEYYYEYTDTDSDTFETSCPTGCTTHINGCNIKGNISQDGEKIYHVPGQEYYSTTQIDAQNGERWFCTETEARANGWRKSYQ